MKMGRKMIALGAIGVVGMLALSGCGRTDDTPTGEAPSAEAIDDSPATGEITISGDDERGAFHLIHFRQCVKRYDAGDDPLIYLARIRCKTLYSNLLLNLKALFRK